MHIGGFFLITTFNSVLILLEIHQITLKITQLTEIATLLCHVVLT